MRWVKLLTAGAVLAGAALVIAAWPAAATAPDAVYSSTADAVIRQSRPQAGRWAAAGDWIKIKGRGTFDITAATVHAKSTFLHYTAAGTVMCSGTWEATAPCLSAGLTKVRPIHQTPS